MTYDVIHFEALGAEAAHLKEETALSQQNGCLPKDLKYLITPDTVQDFLENNPDVVLPDIISTKTHSVLPQTYLDGVKKSIITRSAGYDHYEMLARRANIASLRNYCVGAVAQTAIKFMYATLGLLNEYIACTKSFERNKVDSFMEISPQRVATVFGVGNIGKRIYDLAAANGLYAQAVDIRQDILAEQYYHQIRFVSKEKAIANSDVIINAMNLTRISSSPFYNVNYFSEEVLAKAKPGLCFINVTRGEIAPEAGLLKLYDQGIIAGLGLDVFTDEEEFSKSVTKESAYTTPDCAASKIILQRALDHSANMYVQPHQGFNSDLAVIAKAREAIRHLEAWYRNKGQYFDEQLPYYCIDKIPLEALV
ncbi:MAG: hydroxyacid dehydrogenase [Oscillospiraceae bacterium]|nr:hydroxyacid dehydrogenase [Oscillospiraceae bacterium]